MILPTNEIETIIYFSQKCKDFGFEIISMVSSSFPDAVIKDINSGKDIRVEFEFYSSSFIEHEHNAHACDMIICWKDDFPFNTKFPIWQLCNNSYNTRNHSRIWSEAELINSYIKDFMEKRKEARKHKNNNHWRKIRGSLSQEQKRFIATNDPKDIVKALAESGFEITPRTASNWRVYAAHELGIKIQENES